MVDVFKRMCELACDFTVENTEKDGNYTPLDEDKDIFGGDEDFKKSVIHRLYEEGNPDVDPPESGSFMNTVFGYESKIDNEKFIDEVSGSCAWVFEPTEIRKRLREMAEIERAQQ